MARFKQPEVTSVGDRLRPKGEDSRAVRVGLVRADSLRRNAAGWMPGRLGTEKSMRSERAGVFAAAGLGQTGLCTGSCGDNDGVDKSCVAQSGMTLGNVFRSPSDVASRR
jgi:hypothetical protein